jgi:hypothetical protein
MSILFNCVVRQAEASSLKIDAGIIPITQLLWRALPFFIQLQASPPVS